MPRPHRPRARARASASGARSRTPAASRARSRRRRRGGVTQFGRRVTSPQNLRFTGGRGENPFRPAPDRASHGVRQRRCSTRGLYLPSVGLRRDAALRRSRPAAVQLERDRARVQPRREPAAHEGAQGGLLDLETLEHRLWLRLGLQNIIWGKTEIFRTTDHFNPQDLGLSSLPTLEESRIALWSARACTRSTTSARSRTCASSSRRISTVRAGRPRRVRRAVCAPTSSARSPTGSPTHSYLGAGIAGVDRPESPWKDPSDLEIGGRIEWRWDRFSFALTDFYGHSDLPYADAIFFYERGVDPATGRPVVARLPGQALGTCASRRPDRGRSRDKPRATSPGIAYSTAFASHPYSVTTAQKPYALAGSGPTRCPTARRSTATPRSAAASAAIPTACGRAALRASRTRSRSIRPRWSRRPTRSSSSRRTSRSSRGRASRRSGSPRRSSRARARGPSSRAPTICAARISRWPRRS